ncbi:membrane protein implicated in regulation of membrane protease activity [Aciduliprofundum sp. MAR08-339]|uniref:NfeD family protein n=1 Tax=Aciduliprofundum sp. (strain MAR08-339) TaxID=673860 RepID=UPI0002A4C03E|nr:membrane protein implicated in regulation of membrane protease activity [Aciduliprofundum sp. MAR08-339]
MDFFTLGIILIVFGSLLVLAELAIPGFFIAVPGTVLVILGLVYLFLGNIGVVPAVVITLATAIVATIGVMLFYRVLAKPQLPTTSTIDQMVGKRGIVIAKIEPNSLKGKVRIDSDVWSATADREIDVGKKVEVVKGEGVHLVVREIK